MFHTYVRAGSGTVVDFDRASYLMDQDLLQQSIDAMKREQTTAKRKRMTAPRWDIEYCAQWVWNHYCQLHLEKYDEYFVPDVKPNWDRNDPNPEQDPEPSTEEREQWLRGIVVLTPERGRAALRRLARQVRPRRAKTP